MPDTLPQSKTDIINVLKANRARLKDLGVQRIGLFGSYLHAEQLPESDIDLLVEFKRNLKNFDRFIALSNYLEDLLNHPVDLVTKESLSPYIGPEILDEVEYVEI